MFGAFAMSMSSFCVVSNALRLNMISIRDTKRDKRRKRKKTADAVESEEKKMMKTMKIEGMMCGHCEARVKKVLEALPQVNEARVSHEAGTAEITLQEEISDSVLKETVEAEDYKVLSVE